jgi:predicted MFS family arabinose efflux permease
MGDRENLADFKPAVAFTILSALFTLSMFYRVSNAVIAPDLVRDLGLDPETLGILGGAFFYSFALLQIPMGLLLDRVGPRKVVTLFSFVGALGALIFALSGSFWAALCGRILIGAGMASVLMGTFKVFVLTFPADKFATLSGIIMSVGAIGTIAGTTPLAWLNLAIGWRLTFILTAVLNAFLALSVFSVLRGTDTKPSDDAGRDKDPVPGILNTTRTVVRELSFWQIGFLAFFRYGTFVALQGLWLGPYLITVNGYSSLQAGNLLLMLSLGLILGAPVGGYLADRVVRSTKVVVEGGLLFYCATLLPLTGIREVKSVLFYQVLFFWMGFFTGFGTLTYTHVKELFPLNMSGTVIAWVNFFTMGGGAFFMQVLGQVIKSLTDTHRIGPSQVYHISFLICLVGMAGSLVFYCFSRSRPRQV